MTVVFCPRCKEGRLIRDLDGDACCVTCGHVEYRQIPVIEAPVRIRFNVRKP